jgi:hypothetical protein
LAYFDAVRNIEARHNNPMVFRIVYFCPYQLIFSGDGRCSSGGKLPHLMLREF